MAHSSPVPSRLLVVDDDPAIRKIIKDRFVALGHEVSVAEDGQAALDHLEENDADLMLLDLRMPRLDGFGVLEALGRRKSRPDVIVITAHGSVDAAVKAVKMGAVDFISKPFENAHIEHVVAKALEARRLRGRVQSLETELSGRHTMVAGESKKMGEVVSTLERAAASNATVLLLGESGSGKEVLARFAHEHSARKSGPFVALNCATLSAELLTSELFGHEKGAFTGAVKTKLGRLETAAGGTLFLDEIGELPPELQAKLLRVLQEKEFERVGGTRAIQSDVRIIAATHRDLGAAIADGRFREDLYYRLNVVNLRVPPLRERKEDIPRLAAHFLARHKKEAGRGDLELSSDVISSLVSYDWPGNVRELSNTLERCVVLCPDSSISLADLPEEVRDSSSRPRVERSATEADNDFLRSEDGFHEMVSEAKRQIIRNALSLTENHQTNAAARLGLTQPYLARLMKNLGMPSLRKSTEKKKA